MAIHGVAARAGSGPGNKIIAATLLESLAIRGEMAAHDRALRELRRADGDLASAPAWLSNDAVIDMLSAAEPDSSLARSVGHRLVTPDAIGMALYGLGLASPEKAYRRVQALLPRESASSFWVADEIDSGRAYLSFHESESESESESDSDVPESPTHDASAGTQRGATALCAMRAGMLEAVPSLYGLLPARVVETTCRARGGELCRYEIAWTRTSRSGLIVGLSTGAVLGAAPPAMSILLGLSNFSVAATALWAVGCLGLGCAIGGWRDLQRQLEAVAGARRGHLALFDQVDDTLATKLDALARADAKLDGGESARRPERSGFDPGSDSAATLRDHPNLLSAAQTIHDLAGDLECFFDASDGSKDVKSAGTTNPTDTEVPRGSLRQIRDRAEELVEALATENARSRRCIDMNALLERAIATTRPSLPPRTIIRFQPTGEFDPIECEPEAIERVVAHLLRNAATASQGLREDAEIDVGLRSVDGGVELAVEDRGVGIDPAEIDEVFDPFFDDRAIDIDEGLGLPACLQIVERHGGELRIETEDRPGTRVSLLLPKTR